MQKNNCKLKTIFKKGLSFSIALALGAAATSLNLAKTAEASAPNVSGQRTVYLTGEKIDKTTGTNISNVTHVVVTKGGMEQTVAAIDDVPALTTDVTKLQFATSDTVSGNSDSAFDVTVYDWANIYDTSKTLKVSHNSGTVKTEVLDVLSFQDLKKGKETDHAEALCELLEGGAITIDGDSIAKDAKFDYTKHNGKAISVKVGDVVCPLGTLEVSRNVKAVSLAKEPTENCYIEGEKINLSGLALNVTYEDDGKATVEWTEETKDAFTFSSNDVEQDKEISQTINDITVTYEGVTATEKFTLYFCKTLSKEAGNIAKINGVFDKLDVVDAIALSENNDNYKKLKDDFSDENAQVIFAYDIIANYDASIGKMKVALNVGKNYAGQTVTVKHLSNDEIETFVDKVDSDGIVTVSVSSLSPFMVALGATEEDKSAAAETEQKNAEEKAEAAKKEAAAKSASKSVKTGDASIVAFSVFGFIAFVSAAILVFMKKNRKDFEK